MDDVCQSVTVHSKPCLVPRHGRIDLRLCTKLDIIRTSVRVPPCVHVCMSALLCSWVIVALIRKAIFVVVILCNRYALASHFESFIWVMYVMEYNYWSWNRCQYKLLHNTTHIYALFMGLMSWQHFRRVAHATRRNKHTGCSVPAFKHSLVMSYFVYLITVGTCQPLANYSGRRPDRTA